MHKDTAFPSCATTTTISKPLTPTTKPNLNVNNLRLLSLLTWTEAATLVFSSSDESLNNSSESSSEIWSLSYENIDVSVTSPNPTTSTSKVVTTLLSDNTDITSKTHTYPTTPPTPVTTTITISPIANDPTTIRQPATLSSATTTSPPPTTPGTPQQTPKRA